jgi:hypothetical protein
MNENRVVPLRQKDEIDDRLTEILRSGVRRLITRAVEVEFDTFGRAKCRFSASRAAVFSMKRPRRYLRRFLKSTAWGDGRARRGTDRRPDLAPFGRGCAARVLVLL